MDYEIMLTTLGSKQEELDSQKSKVESAIEESASTLSSMGETPIASLYNKIQDSTDNVKKAYERTSEWFDKYIKELNELENSLASFNCNGVETPTEFKDNFVDIFGKKLIPTLRTDGDKNANTDLGIVNRVSDMMNSVANTAIANSGGGYNGMCEAWAEEQWTIATGMDRAYQSSAYTAWLEYGVSTSKDDIPVGAMIYGSGTGNGVTNPYGHVGIYVGDGMVADQGGVVPLEEWISHQVADCNGQTGYLGWGWYNGVDLSEK